MTLHQTIKSMDGEIVGGNGDVFKVRFPIISNTYEITISEDMGKQLEAIQNNRKMNLERIRDGLALLEDKEAADIREDD